MREISGDDATVKAAQWLAEHSDPVPHVIAEMKDRFGITAGQAAQACTLAAQMRTLRRAHG